MKRIILLLLTVTIFACGTTNSQSSSYQTINTTTFKQGIVDTTVQILDVRTDGEYTGGHIKNATNIDVNESSFDIAIKKLDKTKPTYVYCLSGGRSKTACKALNAAGFTNVYNLDGGVSKWRQDGGTLVIEGPASMVPPKPGITAKEYKAIVTKDKPVLVEFYAPWCGPCKVLKPQVEKIASNNKDKLYVEYINVDDNKELADSLKISNIPVLMYYVKGKKKWALVGAPEEKALYKKLGLPQPATN